VIEIRPSLNQIDDLIEEITSVWTGASAF
jgi:excinuclease UvrABC helicase subunit UvrB